MLQIKVVEKIKTHLVISKFFPKILLILR